MKRKNKIIVIGIFLSVVCSAVLWRMQSENYFSENNLPTKKHDEYKRQEVSIGGKKLTVDIADTDALRTRGLSGRERMEDGDGMLFIFSEPARHNFWMKDMNFPIDIIWISADKKIIDISENISPDTYPKTFSSTVPAQFVLEVPAGWVERYKIKIGDEMEYE